LSAIKLITCLADVKLIHSRRIDEFHEIKLKLDQKAGVGACVLLLPLTLFLKTDLEQLQQVPWVFGCSLCSRQFFQNHLQNRFHSGERARSTAHGPLRASEALRLHTRPTRPTQGLPGSATLALLPG
jgi:hypothetical protein